MLSLSISTIIIIINVIITTNINKYELEGSVHEQAAFKGLTPETSRFRDIDAVPWHAKPHSPEA